MFDMGRTDKIALTPEQERWLVRHFKHTTNPEIARRLGISETTMHRFARELRLTKSRQHMRKTQRNAADKAKESHIRNGTYPPKGYRIPRSEEFQFKAGVTPVERLGKRSERKRIEKSVETRRKTIREEKAKALFGLPRRTKLRVVKRPHYVACQRYYLRKLGYIIPWGSFTAYYGPGTQRSEDYENRTRANCERYVHFEYKPISEMV